MTKLPSKTTLDPAMDEHDVFLDTSGLACPMPLLKTKLNLAQMAPGEILLVVASDPGSARDIPAWVDQSPHELSDRREADGFYRFVITCGPTNKRGDG